MLGDPTEKQRVEIGFVYLNKLFRFSDWGFLGVFAVASAFVYYSFYNFLKKYDILCVGTFVFLCFGCMTNFDNIVRQAIAIALFNYSLLFIQKKKYYIALLICLIAPAFHSSAYVIFLMMSLLPLLQRVVLPKNTMYATVVVLFILYYFDFFSDVKREFFSISFVVNSIYGDYADVDFLKNYIGVAFIIKTVLCLAPISIIDKVKDKFIILSINMSWVSVILGILFAEIPFFYRITDYFTLFNIITISYYFCYCWHQKEKIKYAYSYVVLLGAILYNHVNSYYGLNNTYDTIFGSNCRENRFYVRLTFDDAQRKGSNFDREDYYILVK